MDKNTIIGILLIVAIFVGYGIITRPTPEQLAEQQALLRIQDSIAAAQRAITTQEIEEVQNQKQAIISENTEFTDSILFNRYGNFAEATKGEEQLITLENQKLKIKLSSKGGRIYSAQLKNYTNHRNDSLYLFDGTDSNFDITLRTIKNHDLNVSEFYFEPVQVSGLQAILRLNAGEGESLDFIYTLHEDDYVVDFNMIANNLPNEFAQEMQILWEQKIRQQEGGRSFEDRYSYLSYKYLDDNVEHLSESKDDKRNVSNRVKWIGFKDQFFSSVFIANESFESSTLESFPLETDTLYMKEYRAQISTPFFPVFQEGGLRFSFFFGPNDYTLLKGYESSLFSGQNLELDQLVPLGWSLFRVINQWLIIPIFHWLTNGGLSLGLAIFLLTLIIKTLLFPLMYKSFMSSAKTRVLKPQIAEITAKFPGQENAMNRQKKTMELYKQVGVNPMAGCLPMLFQMPFLLALYAFFPSAIQLRQESFLWASDLSTYDAVIHWSGSIPLLGNHISLFCLLFCVVQIIYQKFAMDMNSTGQEQMPGMKWMMYLMPVMMLFILNSYPSGLNYYYLISSMITIMQTLAFRLFINENKLLAKLEANKKKAKPAKKKSGFMARLEEAQRQQQARLKEQQKKGKR